MPRVQPVWFGQRDAELLAWAKKQPEGFSALAKTALRAYKDGGLEAIRRNLEAILGGRYEPPVELADDVFQGLA